jgi:hypothetical protein
MKMLLIASLLSFGAYAKVENFTLTSGKKVTVDVPANWEAAKDLFGLPLTILGPWANESRPVLTIVPTGVKSSKMPEADFKKLFTDFKKEKDEWVQSHKGELVSYEPVTSVEYKGLKGHFIGAEFKINNVLFIERSYYLYCKEELYNLKYSMRDEHRKYTKDLQKMVEAFKCE